MQKVNTCVVDQTTIAKNSRANAPTRRHRPWHTYLALGSHGLARDKPCAGSKPNAAAEFGATAEDGRGHASRHLSCQGPRTQHGSHAAPGQALVACLSL